MGRIFRKFRISPALVVAVVALVAAFGGGAVAGVAVEGLNGKEKRQVRQISLKQVKRLVARNPSRSAGQAGSAGSAGQECCRTLGRGRSVRQSGEEQPGRHVDPALRGGDRRFLRSRLRQERHQLRSARDDRPDRRRRPGPGSGHDRYRIPKRQSKRGLRQDEDHRRPPGRQVLSPRRDLLSGTGTRAPDTRLVMAREHSPGSKTFSRNVRVR